MNNLTVKNHLRFTEREREHFSDPIQTAQWLLGKVICRKLPGGEVVRLYITETEAYEHDDESCYGHDGKKTKANSPLFEQSGTCCVFGGMLLISCGEKNKADNVLIRSAGNERTYYDGPFKIYKGLQLGKELSGIDLLNNRDMWLEYPAEEKPCCKISRVGLSKNRRGSNLNHRFIIL